MKCPTWCLAFLLAAFVLPAAHGQILDLDNSVVLDESISAPGVMRAVKPPVPTATPRATSNEIYYARFDKFELKGAHPSEYDTTTGIGSVTWKNAVSSLAPYAEYFSCGDIALFLLQFRGRGTESKYVPDKGYKVQVGIRATAASLDLGVGFIELVSGEVLSTSTERKPDASTIVSDMKTSDPFYDSKNMERYFNFTVSGIKHDETFLVQFGLRLHCAPGAKSNNAAERVGIDSFTQTDGKGFKSYSTGTRTVPLKLGDLAGAGEPYLKLVHLVTLPGESCEKAVPRIKVTEGDHVKHCVIVWNEGSETAYNVILEDWGIDSNSPIKITGLVSSEPKDAGSTDVELAGGGYTTFTSYESAVDEVGVFSVLVVVQGVGKDGNTYSASGIAVIETIRKPNVPTASPVPITRVSYDMSIVKKLAHNKCNDPDARWKMTARQSDVVIHCYALTNTGKTSFRILTVTESSNLVDQSGSTDLGTNAIDFQSGVTVFPGQTIYVSEDRVADRPGILTSVVAATVRNIPGNAAFTMANTGKSKLFVSPLKTKDWCYCKFSEGGKLCLKQEKPGWCSYRECGAGFRCAEDGPNICSRRENQKLVVNATQPTPIPAHPDWIACYMVPAQFWKCEEGKRGSKCSKTMDEEASDSDEEEAKEIETGYTTEKESKSGTGSDKESSTGYGTEKESSTGYGTEKEPSTGYTTEKESSTGYKTEKESSTGYKTEKESSTGYKTEKE